MANVIDGNAVAETLRENLREAIDALAAADARPGLATVLMSDDAASETYVSMKHEDCRELGIEDFHADVAADAPTEELIETVESLNDRPAVHGVLVQTPLPEHVDSERALQAVAPEKDVDGFHFENVGRLVRDEPQFRPCTPHGVQKLLEHADAEIEGADVVIVGRSNLVGKPLANLLLRRADDGNATVTVCHSHTDDLGAKTRAADIVVTACGVPGLVTGEMLSPGVTVIDVGYNRIEADNERGYEVVGDVEYDSAREMASAITPVPGGVGPMTRAMLLYNTVRAASKQSGIDVELP